MNTLEIILRVLSMNRETALEVLQQHSNWCNCRTYTPEEEKAHLVSLLEMYTHPAEMTI